MIKKIVLTFLCCIFMQSSSAKVIELDNRNSDHCRQQLANSHDQFPIVFIYMKHCPYADQLRPLYEKASEEVTDREFFAFNFKDHDDPRLNYLRQAHDCLGKLPLVSPRVSVYILDEDESGPMIMGEYKSGLNGISTKEDIINFINMEREKKAVTTLVK